VRTLSRLCLPVLIASATLLSACGTNAGYGNPTGSGLSTVSVSGAFGSVPTVTWTSIPDFPSKTTVQTAITGTGPAIPADRGVEAKVYVSDAQAILQKNSLCQTSGKASAGACSTTFPLTAPAIDLIKTLQGVPYQVLPTSAKTLQIPASSTGLFSAFRSGAHIGSRVIGLMPSTLIGQAVQSDSIPAIGIGNHDAVLVIVDFVSLDAAPPTVSDVPASQVPAIVLKNGKPVGMTFTGIAKPTAKDGLKRAILTQGSGAEITASSTITFDYLGSIYGAAKPFQENYSQKPISYPLAQLVPGWQTGLVGVKAGSRVVLAIPPALGYGAQAQTGIPANSTLYFVLDIVSVS
jgi:peptidylprolyl isomerase